MARGDGRPAEASGDRRSGLVRDAAVTIATRFGLAILIFATDVILANALGPAAKGRFALVLLYSQLAATVIGVGMDQAIAVVTGRGPNEGRHAFANAMLWTAVVGGAAVLASLWLYGVPAAGPPSGPLVSLFPNLSAGQFTFAALAIPAELFFNLGLFALLGRRQVAAYSVIRLLRRLTLLALLLATRARGQPRPRGRADHQSRVTRRSPRPRSSGRRRASDSSVPCRRSPCSARSSATADGPSSARSPNGSSSARTRSSSTRSRASARPASIRSRAASPRRSGTSRTRSAWSCSAGPSTRRPMPAERLRS